MDEHRTVEEENFAALLDASLARAFTRLQVGDRVQGNVVSIGPSAILVDVGQRSEGAVGREEFSDEELAGLAVGDRLDLFVARIGRGGITLSRAMKARSLDLTALAEAAASGVPIEGKVSATNKGGFTVDLPGGKGFVPFSMMEAGPRQPPETYIGRSFRFRVLEVRGRDVILSRAALQREEQAAERERLLSELHEGDVRDVPVIKVERFGLFVDLGAGVHGLVPISELSWSRTEDAEEVARVGDVIRVKILKIEKGDRGPRISASLKQVGDDPWQTAAEKLAVGTRVEGRVTRLAPFGAFVEVLPGIEGLVHVSEMSAPGKAQVRGPGEVVKTGDRVTVAIVSVEPRTRRLSLSMKEEPTDDLEPEVRARFVRPEGERPAVEATGDGVFAEAFRRAREREAQRKRR